MHKLLKKQKELIAEKIIDASIDAIITIDSLGTVVSWNPAAQRIFMYSESEVLGVPVTIIIPHRMRTAHGDGMSNYNKTGVSKLAGSVVELIGLRKDNTEIPIEMSIFAVMGNNQNFFTALIRDITERKRLEEALRESEDHMRRLANIDVLTDLENRRSVMQKLQSEIDRASRSATPFSIIMLDIDNFKLVNDVHGHGAGDDVLKLFSNTIRLNVRCNDICGRLGGEEFIIILPGCVASDARALADKVRNEVLITSFTTRGGDMSISCSIGVAQWNQEPIDVLMNRCDAALYSAKRNGRNCVVLSCD